MKFHVRIGRKVLWLLGSAGFVYTIATIPVRSTFAATPSGVTNIFKPLSTLAQAIYEVSLLVLAICAGIFFVVAGVLTYTLLAHAVFLAAVIANRIWNDGAQLSAFKLEVAGILLFLLLVLVPLTFFSSQLLYAKRRALREYGNVASIYVRDFREKWLEGQNPEGKQLLGTGDIQSLADLGNSFAVTSETRLVPFSKEMFFR